MHSTQRDLYTIRRECCELDARAIKAALIHARVAGLLDSYDDDAFFDAERGEIFVQLLASRMHPADRDNFGCERMVADRIVNKTLSPHHTSVPSAPPSSTMPPPRRP